MNLPVIILGGGGHAKVLVEALRTTNIIIVGITDADPAKQGTAIMGVPVLGDDSVVGQHDPSRVRLVNGLGSVNIPAARASLFETFTSQGFSFATVIHPRAIVASDAVLAEGAQIMAGAVIQPGVIIGRNSIVNTGAIVDHDCMIGDHAHLSPGAMLSGGVRIGNNTHVGTGATVIQGITIGAGCLVAAGAVVISNVPDGTAVMGVPARISQ